MKVLFVASAIHVPYIWRSQNKVLGIRVSVSLFFKPFCIYVLVDFRCHPLYSVLEKNCIICFYSVKLRQDVTSHSSHALYHRYN